MLAIAELPRQFGVRGYQLSQVPGQHHLADHEEAAIPAPFLFAPEVVAATLEQLPALRSALPTPESEGKDPNAAALGRKGGRARAEKMTPERRAEIARKAAAKRRGG